MPLDYTRGENIQEYIKILRSVIYGDSGDFYFLGDFPES